MTGPDEPRRLYSVGAVKIPHADRDVARAVLPDDGAAVERGYLSVLGADTADDDEKFPVGADVAYAVELTDDEVERFAGASNVRYVEEAQRHYPQRAVGRPTGALPIPSLDTLAWMRARYVDLRRWHGRDVRVAVLDQGTTAAVRAAMGLTLVARTITSGATLPPGEELMNPEHDHGCLVAPNAIPAGGLLLDAIISNGTNGNSNDAWEAAGITWAVDNGAKVINLSFGGDPAVPGQVFQDACAYARDNGGVQIVISAGNDNLPDLASPSSASRLFANVHSSIAFDPATDRRGMFSNHHADGSGCGAGVDVESLDIHGAPLYWSGTSASAPHMAHLLARALTGGTYTPAQVGAAFKANTRDTGAGASEQGGGAYDLHRALVALGSGPTVAAGVGAPVHVDTRAATGGFSGFLIAPAASAQTDDMQIVVLLSAPSNRIPYVRPHNWVELASEEYSAPYERNAGQDVDSMYLRVLAKPYTVDEPESTLLRVGPGGFWSAFATITVRGAGGLDPERFVPTCRFGTSASVEAPAVVPATTNDLQISVFAQLQETSATTGTLSVPSGLTSRGFWRPASDSKGFTLLVTSRALPDGARTPAYTSASNATDTWAAMSLTIPSAAPAVAPVVQTEPPGPPGGMLAILPRS